MSAATTTGVTVRWIIAGPFESGNYTFAIRVDDTNAENQFKILGWRDTETEARSACCGLLTMLSLHLGIPASAMEEVR